MVKRIFTAEQVDIIKKDYPYNGSDIPELLNAGFNRHQIQNKAYESGICVLAEVKKRKFRENWSKSCEVNKRNFLMLRTPKERIFYHRLNLALSTSNQRKTNFIKKEDIPKLVSYCIDLYDKQNGKCALSGQFLEIPSSDLKKADWRRSNCISIDRIDSSKGYEEGNMQIVHKDINYMKQEFGQDYYIKMCKAVAKTHTKRKTATAKS
jgi:hypothetical protein